MTKADDDEAIVASCVIAVFLYCLVVVTGTIGWGCLARFSVWLIHIAFHTADINWLQAGVVGFILTFIMMTINGLVNNSKEK